MFTDTFGRRSTGTPPRRRAIFVVLVVSVILLERVRRWADHDADHQPGSDRTSLTSGLAFLAVKALVSKLAVASLALLVYDHFRLFTLDLGESLGVGRRVRDARLRLLLGAPGRAPDRRAVGLAHGAPFTGDDRLHDGRSRPVDGGGVQAVARSVAAVGRVPSGGGDRARRAWRPRWRSSTTPSRSAGSRCWSGCS